MTHIDLQDPPSEERLAAYANRHGMDIASVVSKLAREHLPPVAQSEIASDAERRAAVDRLMQSIQDAVPTDPEELAKAEAEFEEFVRHMNDNRLIAGDTPLFDDQTHRP